MDSKAIAEKLEAEHASPPLHLDSAELKAVEEVIPKIRDALRGVWLPPLPGKLLNPSSAEYFRTTRAKRYGMVSCDIILNPSFYFRRLYGLEINIIIAP
jgi:hypothetical protein